MANRSSLFNRAQPGGVWTIADMAEHPGDIWFVDSGATYATDSVGAGRSPDIPFATLDYAIGMCTASKGDVIYLMPGHAENLSAATTLTMDVAGVKVIGLGTGSLRPTFSTTAAAGTFNITAANCWLENVVIVGNYLNVVANMTIGAAAHYLTLKNIEMANTSVILGALVQISVASGITDLTIDGFKFNEIVGGLTAAATNVILAAGTYDRFTLKRARIFCHSSAAAVSLSTGIGYNIWLEDIQLRQTETSAGLAIACHNTSTGMVENVVSVNLCNGVKGVTGTGLSVGANVCYSNAVNAYAGLFSYTIDS